MAGIFALFLFFHFGILASRVAEFKLQFRLKALISESPNPSCD